MIVFNINIRPLTIYLTNETSADDNKPISQQVTSSVVIKLPKLLMFSTGHKSLTHLKIENFPFCIDGWTNKKSLFPWSLSLSNFTCYSLLEKKSVTLVEPVTTNVTLAISTKIDDKDSTIKDDDNGGLSVYFHIDTTPITTLCYKNQVFINYF